MSIQALTPEGLGCGESDDRTVLVRNALPGERVTARVLKRGAGTLFAQAHQVCEPAAIRQRPPCRVFPRCGGCVLQHADYAAQLRHKVKTLHSALAGNAVEAELERPPVAGPRLYYRHKARMGVRRVGENVLVGFRESFSSRVVRMSHCTILAPPLAQLFPDLQATIGKLERRDRIPQIELVAGDRETAVVVRHLVPLESADRRLLTCFAQAQNSRLVLQSGGYDSLELLWPPDAKRWLSYSLIDFGLTFRFGLDDFVQINPHVNRELARAVATALERRRRSVVADLFCGVGNFSLVLARRGLAVRGYDAGTGAIARAKLNAALNGVAPRCEFRRADLYHPGHVLPQDVDQLLLDPPRSGAGPNLESWLRSPMLDRVVYVSCNPVTFASDAARLVRCGFGLADVGIFDMFPHTAHVETLGIFVRTG